MSAIDKIHTFYTEYEAKLNKLNTKLDETTTRINELQLEITYIQSVELPKASELRLLNDDAAMEVKTKKKLDKLQAEYQEKQEDLLIIQHTINRFQVDSANSVLELEIKLFRAEKQLNYKGIFDRMLQHKKTFLTNMGKESEAFNEFYKAELLLNTIKANGGKSTSSASIEIPYDIDLTVSRNEVVKIVKGK